MEIKRLKPCLSKALQEETDTSLFDCFGDYRGVVRAFISRNSEVQFKHIHSGFTEKSELARRDVFQNNLTNLSFR